MLYRLINNIANKSIGYIAVCEKSNTAKIYEEIINSKLIEKNWFIKNQNFVRLLASGHNFTINISYEIHYMLMRIQSRIVLPAQHTQWVISNSIGTYTYSNSTIYGNRFSY